MKDHEVEQLLKRAVSIVEGAGVPAELQATALAKVWDTLSGTGGARATPPRRHTATRKTLNAGEQANSKQTKKAKGPKSLVAKLVEEGILDEWMGLPDVQGALRVRGYKLQQQALSPALLRLTQEKTLEREERDTTDGRKQWVYRKSS